MQQLQQQGRIKAVQHIDGQFNPADPLTKLKSMNDDTMLRLKELLQFGYYKPIYEKLKARTMTPNKQAKVLCCKASNGTSIEFPEIFTHNEHSLKNNVSWVANKAQRRRNLKEATWRGSREVR